MEVENSEQLSFTLERIHPREQAIIQSEIDAILEKYDIECHVTSRLDFLKRVYNSDLQSYGTDSADTTSTTKEEESSSDAAPKESGASDDR
jgi:hypothetical protein